MTIAVDPTPSGGMVATVVVISGESDLLDVRSALRTAAERAGLRLTATTKLVTAGSELARNILRYATGGQGTVTIEECTTRAGRGVRAVFVDQGPGIADLDEVMRDGFSSGGSLGIGLPGSRRLVDEFTIDSMPGRGTTVVISQWDR
ncbi:anti-sigma regulatory factor [Actinoplanes subtropicus]|uniref:anti-sigma regulatory factor n=1 Tax=Actinoplanes subtropicus TaxID=543632 RepID=UPI0012F736B3|nr:anti-sigma regulatory factor [Actinoplanes subtropicus]